MFVTTCALFQFRFQQIGFDLKHSSSEQEVQRERHAQQVWEHFEGQCRTTAFALNSSAYGECEHHTETEQHRTAGGKHTTNLHASVLHKSLGEIILTFYSLKPEFRV